MKYTDICGGNRLLPPQLLEINLDELQSPLKHYKKVLGNKLKRMSTLHTYLDNQGYEILGSGAYADVYAKPGEKFVIKTVGNEDCYVDFVSLLSRNMNPHLPRVGKIRTFVDRSSRNNPITWFIIPIERLTPVDIRKHIQREDVMFAMAASIILNPRHDHMSYFIRPMLPKSPHEIYEELKDKFPKLVEAIEFVSTNFNNKCEIDIHDENIMFRGDTLVIIDPVSYKV